LPDRAAAVVIAAEGRVGAGEDGDAVAHALLKVQELAALPQAHKGVGLREAPRREQRRDIEAPLGAGLEPDELALVVHQPDRVGGAADELRVRPLGGSVPAAAAAVLPPVALDRPPPAHERAVAPEPAHLAV